MTSAVLDNRPVTTLSTKTKRPGPITVKYINHTRVFESYADLWCPQCGRRSLWVNRDLSICTKCEGVSHIDIARAKDNPETREALMQILDRQFQRGFSVGAP